MCSIIVHFQLKKKIKRSVNPCVIPPRVSVHFAMSGQARNQKQEMKNQNKTDGSALEIYSHLMHADATAALF